MTVVDIRYCGPTTRGWLAPDQWTLAGPRFTRSPIQRLAFIHPFTRSPADVIHPFTRYSSLCHLFFWAGARRLRPALDRLQRYVVNNGWQLHFDAERGVWRERVGGPALLTKRGDGNRCGFEQRRRLNVDMMRRTCEVSHGDPTGAESSHTPKDNTNLRRSFAMVNNPLH